MAENGASRLVLTNSAPLRLLTLFLFYFTQGFPIGLFFYAVPGWMAASGASTGEIATVVGTAALPWSLKLINGFLIDRYTFLPMGRRRSWIIGAQAVLVLTLLVAALLDPGSRDVLVLSAFAFVANSAVTFQDAGIDSLAVDIMAENERAKAGGVMFGAQMLGISGATAMGGALLQDYGFATGMAAAALIPGAVMVFGILIREREGERRLPWTSGESHAFNREVHVGAWLPLLRGSFIAMTVPLSLALIPVLLSRSMPAGAHEAFHPILTTGTVGWTLSEYTQATSTAQLAAGLLGLTLGGFLVDAVGTRRALPTLLVIGSTIIAAMALSRDHWQNELVVSGYIFGMEIIAVFMSIAIVPICMRLCAPSVAATQFTIYMAVSNFGRPLGATLAASTAGQGLPDLMYAILAGIWLAIAVLVIFARFPEQSLAFETTADVLPQGEGLAPVRD